MRVSRWIRATAMTAVLLMGLGGPTASAATTCTFTVSGTTWSLNGSCTTDESIVIPNGFTLQGNGHTITAVDPAGGHFTGGVIENGGASANVANVKLTTSALSNVCDAGDDRLRGVYFNGASGKITDVTVLSLNQGASGCQEGNAIEVRNLGASQSTVSVDIRRNVVSDYQKTGIVANGNVKAHIAGNTVDGGGPVGYIARNGIQIGYGARAHVQDNLVQGNSYTGASAVSGGILVVGGPGYDGDFCVGVDIVGNRLSGNDVGVFVSQYEADFTPPAKATNVKVVNNVIGHDAVTNGYVYQAGVSDVGNNDKIINNKISGAGYNPATLPGSTFAVDADPAFTSRPKVHANR
jgi:hypothetical protein